MAEIPPPFEFAEKEGEDGLSLDHISAGEKRKKAQLRRAHPKIFGEKTALIFIV